MGIYIYIYIYIHVCVIPKHGYYMYILWASYKQRRWKKGMLCPAFLESCSCLPPGSETLPSASTIHHQRLPFPTPQLAGLPLHSCPAT